LEEISLKKEGSKKLILSLKFNLETILEKSIKINCGNNKEKINLTDSAKKELFIN